MADSRDFSVTTQPYNTTMVTGLPINVYYLGPLGNLVWVPPTIIIIIFFIFFTYSFIEFHANNKERYVARRHQLMVEYNTRDQLTSSYSESTLNDMYPKRRLRPFALQMNLKNVLRDIWRCHGANPRKLQALFVQMQMQMLGTSRLEADGEPSKSVTSLELANSSMMIGQFPGGIPGGFNVSRSRRSSNTSQGSHDSPLRRIRQLPATPPLTSQRLRPILQKASSFQSSLTKTSSYGHNVSFHLPSTMASSTHLPQGSPPPMRMGQPLSSASSQTSVTGLSGQALLNLQNNPFITMGIIPPSFPSGFANSALLHRDTTLDDDCDNDFISEGASHGHSSQAESKKGKYNVMMLQKLSTYKRT